MGSAKRQTAARTGAREPGAAIGRDAACEVLFPHLGAPDGGQRLASSPFTSEAGSVNPGYARRQGWCWPTAGVSGCPRKPNWKWTSKSIRRICVRRYRSLRASTATITSPAPLKVEGDPPGGRTICRLGHRPREALDALRQEARLALARDRADGVGRSGYEDVVEAWEACFSADPTSEEAATALVRAYLARDRHALAAAMFRRCCESLEELGVRVSPALERAMMRGSNAGSPAGPLFNLRLTREERRLISVFFAELVGPVGNK